MPQPVIRSQVGFAFQKLAGLLDKSDIQCRVRAARLEDPGRSAFARADEENTDAFLYRLDQDITMRCRTNQDDTSATIKTSSRMVVTCTTIQAAATASSVLAVAM